MNKKSKDRFGEYQLNIDYITVNFKGLDFNSPKIKKLICYLCDLGFDCIESFNSSRANEKIKTHENNKFQVYLVYTRPRCISLRIPGANSRKFYYFIQKCKIDWELFSSGQIGRLDLYYDRENKLEDLPSAENFLDVCKAKINPAFKKTSSIVTKNGLSTLTIGSRTSDNYFRIYQKTGNVFRFEHEIKKRGLKPFRDLLISKNPDDLKKFESLLSIYCIKSWANRLDLSICYVDWIAKSARTLRSKTYKFTLKSDYLDPTIILEFEDRQDFFYLLNFLKFCSTLKYKQDCLGKNQFRKVNFKLIDFLKYNNNIEIGKKFKNHYQLKKAISFCQTIQKNTCLNIVKNNYVRSIMIPLVETQKIGKYWWCEVWLSEEYFLFNYPFLFPDFLNSKPNKYEIEVQLKFLQIYTSESTEKKFLIREFIDDFPYKLSGKQQSDVKKYFLKVVSSFKESKLIEQNYKVIHKGKEIETTNLNSKNISEGFIINEIINYK